MWSKWCEENKEEKLTMQQNHRPQWGHIYLLFSPVTTFLPPHQLSLSKQLLTTNPLHWEELREICLCGGTRDMVLIYILLSFCRADPLHEETPPVISNTTCWAPAQNPTLSERLVGLFVNTNLTAICSVGAVKCKFANWSEHFRCEGKHLLFSTKREREVQNSGWSVLSKRLFLTCLLETQ